MIISNTTPISEIRFSLEEIRNNILAQEIDRKETPLVGISGNHNEDETTLTDTYAESVRRAGGIPMIIPFSTDPKLITECVSRCDAIIMSGGGDLMPAWFGEAPSPNMGKANTHKDFFDLSIIHAALRFSIPVLAICRGMQLANVVLGGKLYQDIPSQCPGAIGHNQSASRYEVWHSVSVHREGRLKDILGCEELMVNSFHHQAASTLPPCTTVTAVAPDGIIEGVDYYPEHNILAVQWHPEALACHGMEPHGKLFDFIVGEGRLYRLARKLHASMLTADTHCDTPMIFSGKDDYDFTQRAEKALVDLPRMTDGGLDVSFMVAYIPQDPLSEEGYKKAYDYTERTLDAIDTVMSKTEGKAVVARLSDELISNKSAGKKSIVKGIENAYPMGKDLSLLEHYAKKGVRYITLCHNGDNDICDSASKTQNTYGGLSDFGREVVREMNRLGILIDISHAGSDTIRDVLSISDAPVIASHSSCRALCDHPRNLTDEEIRAVAATGGLTQICMYKGFVLKDSDKASLLDFVDHISHACSLVGVEHVGIGTDFDGDGEVIGCRDASHVIRLTVELLRRGFSDTDIRKMWGENVLRVLRSVEDRFRANF
ncbi:membrane dipeptidase [Porphyromonas sp.]|uniref:membrane dipeptidase n=1 Tax=Porphyromonas sp. TaxID=1924944 RepID=UPI0026DCC310|nr:membrane dipeptidase [Porphyromonas sp.]MDO4770873.1 membrane dipeptidase [Porphyromonas sp.]